MKMKLSILFLLMVTVQIGFSQKLKKFKVDEHITVYLPSDFVEMPEIDLIRKYPSVRQPKAAFTNTDRLIDFSVNQSATRWGVNDMEIARDFFKASVLNLYDEVEMLQEGTRELSGYTMAYFEFNSKVAAQQNDITDKPAKLGYSYVQYVITEEGTWVFSFHAPVRMRDEWRPVAEKIMTSVKVK